MGQKAEHRRPHRNRAICGGDGVIGANAAVIAITRGSIDAQKLDPGFWAGGVSVKVARIVGLGKLDSSMLPVSEFAGSVWAGVHETGDWPRELDSCLHRTDPAVRQPPGRSAEKSALPDCRLTPPVCPVDFGHNGPNPEDQMMGASDAMTPVLVEDFDAGFCASGRFGGGSSRDQQSQGDGDDQQALH